jgi:alanine-synthesizing transaminase
MDWMPDLDDIRRKITPRTKGIVVINPNNPTGALYSDELLQGRSSRSPASTS